MADAPSKNYTDTCLRCSKCYEALPLYKSCTHSYSATHGQYVEVYNGGQYYKLLGSDNKYECDSCFNKPITSRRGEEQLGREGVTRREEELNQRTTENHGSNMLEELESGEDYPTTHLSDFEANRRPVTSSSDQLLEILSVKCRIPVPDLSLSRLTADQLVNILSVLDKLLFDEWIGTRPSLDTLQHAQVFITELCILSVETFQQVSLQNISDHVQFLVGSISQSAHNAHESFLLTQALYLNLMHFFTVHSSKNTDAVLIARQWAEDELSTEQLFLIDFLSTLTSSLQSATEKATVFILKMEIQCLKLLLAALTHLNSEETHSECTEMLLRLVQTNGWTPTEAVTLLKALSQKNAKDVSITEVLRLVHVYDLSPDWTDEFGRSLLQALDSAGPERFHQDLQETLRSKDESSLAAALAGLKISCNLDDCLTESLKNITYGVLRYSKHAPKHAPLMKECFKSVTMKADDMQNSLSQLCRAVFDSKGWWPTVKQMLRWCVLVLNEKSEVPQLVGVEGDPCVTAMFAATQVFRGKKLDIVLSSDVHLEEQTEEWSDFYKHLGISVNTNVETTLASFRDVYKADIVFGTMDDFVSDYFQHGLEVMTTGIPQLSRGFIIDEQCLSPSHNLELSRLKGNDLLVFAVESLQSLMGKFHSEDVEQRQQFIKALFQVLHTNLNANTDNKLINIFKKIFGEGLFSNLFQVLHTNVNANTDNKLINIFKKIFGKGLSSNDVFILTFLENVLRVVAEQHEKNRTSQAGKWYVRILFACLENFQASKQQIKELFQMVLNLEEQRLWSPEEVLNLLGALTDHHLDEDCVSIMKILHMLTTYQVSSTWTDSNNQSLLKLLESCQTKILIKHLEKSFRHEKIKSVNTLFDEIRKMKDIDEETLSKSYSVVTHVVNLIETGDIKIHMDAFRARALSRSRNTEDLQEVLAVICNAVHLHRAKGKWWPRATQMISWCFLALSDTGKLLEVGTGEGKSCVIAMFAVLRALRGEKVDVVSTSPLLCERDAKEWGNFFKFFEITADTNTNKEQDQCLRECYQKDIVYGTMAQFAGDYLRQVFEMRDVRLDRSFHCIIVDEVDSLLLDQGTHTTYLPSPMVSMQHLNVLLAMIWSHVSQYGFLSTGQQMVVHGPPASFFKAIFDSINTEGTEINDPMDILYIAEQLNSVPKGFTEDFYKSGKDEVLKKLETVSQDDVIDFFQKLEHAITCGFTVYTLDDEGLLCLRKHSQYSSQDGPELTFLVLEDGLCCPLYASQGTLIKPIAELISEKIQYTPCANSDNKISVPGFLKGLVEKKVSVWVQHAFRALQMKEEQDYVVVKDNIYPVNFTSTGVVEVNQTWCDGLHQFLEFKHQIKESTVLTITKYVSNYSLLQKYQGVIYGATGTIGSKIDMLYLQNLYPNLSACRMPTFNRKKLYEVEGSLKSKAEDWKSEIKQVVLAQVSPNSYRGGRAALVICESINKAKEIEEELRGCIPGEILLYCRSDVDDLSKIEKKLLPGDVIVATNLAGRGTDTKVSKQVNSNGGLFVILSFLSENTRVERQAFGRTARKGEPGSAQIILSSEHLQPSLRTVSSLEEAKRKRDELAAEKMNNVQNDLNRLNIEEDLLSEYARTLQDIHKNTDEDEKAAVVDVINEFWGIWLQTNSGEIEQLKKCDLQKSLKADLSLAESQSLNHISPCSSIYHYIQFGNVALSKNQWDVSIRLFEKAMRQDESWAAIAFYNHAYCILQQRGANYLTRAIDDLKKAQESLKYLSEELTVRLSLGKICSANSGNTEPTSQEKQLTNRCNMLGYLDKSINETVQKLDDIKQSGKNAVTNISPIVLMSFDEDLQEAALNLDHQGLKYVFSVEEEPQFSWGGLMVFCLGVLQIAGGAVLLTCTGGTMALVGLELVIEGLFDCIHGIKSMVTGEFSWKSWALTKAVSVGLSVFSLSVGKVIAKGLKPFKLQQMLALGALSSRLLWRASAITNMKNSVSRTFKEMTEEIMTCELRTEKEEITSRIKSAVKDGIVKNVRSKMEKESFTSLLNYFMLSKLEEERQFHDFMMNEVCRGSVLAYFRDLTKYIIQSLYADLSWQSEFNSSISKVIEGAKADTRGTVQNSLMAVQDALKVELPRLAVDPALNLSDKLFSKLKEELNKFKAQDGVPRTVMKLSPSGTKILSEFKQDLADTIIASLADALVEVFQHNFSSHTAPLVQGEVNSIIGRYARTTFNNNRTEELLRAEENSRYIAHMPVDPGSAAETGELSRSHAEMIVNPMTPGSILDIRVLSEATGTNIVVLTQDSDSRLMRKELNPSTRAASQTVTLIYRPRSAEYPDGHYDVQINHKTVRIDSEDRSCLFHALARGMNPDASEEDVAVEAQRLRTVVADTLLRHPGKWEPFVKRKVWTASIRQGDWFMLQGAAQRRKLMEETRDVLEEDTGRIILYQEWLSELQNRRGLGQIMNADHQPALNSILRARQLNQNSRLARAMRPTSRVSIRGADLPTVVVPREVHREFPSTISPLFRRRLAEAISRDDVEGTFRLTIIGSRPRFRTHPSNNFSNFQNDPMSSTRLAIFEESFQRHSIEMVETWFNRLRNSGVMTETHRDNIIAWIKRRGYDDQNDPYREEVSRILRKSKRRQ